MANEYISPTGFNDPNGSWVGETNAYDNNLMTKASTSIPAKSWSNYIELTIDLIYCSKIKFYAAYNGTGGINSIDLDIYYSGSWHNLFEGSYISFSWVEKTFTAQYVSKMRMRFYNNSSEMYIATFVEAMFYKTIGKPTVTTNAASSVAGALATLNGNITNTGGEAPTTRGFVYKEGIAGAEQDASEAGYFSTGAYSKALTGLDPTKKYYFRAYATNLTGGTGYGDWKSFGVDVGINTVGTCAATLIEADNATLNGEMIETDGQDATERGFQWKIGATGDITNLPETGTFGIGAFSLVLEDLSANIEYYFRAYAVNDAGTGYGDWLSFTTDYTNPEVVTHNATDELKNQVTGNGEIVSTGGQDCDERGFDYGLMKVATWQKSEDAGSYGVGLFDLDITGLTTNTEYWYRAWAKYDLFNAVKRTTSAYHKTYPQFQIAGDYIYYIWWEDDGDNYQIWTAVSNLDGSDFVATKRTATAKDSSDPQLQVVGTKIYYVWDEPEGDVYNQIWTAVMNIDGSGWVATKQTSTDYEKFRPQFQVVGSYIYYVWHEYDGSKFQIWTAISDLNGENFTATKKTTTAYDKSYAQLQVVGTVIYYTWTEKDASSKYQIWVATMDTDGTDWAAEKKTTTAYSKYSPQLQVVDTVIYYIWRETDGSNFQIWIATMDTDGTDWAATKKTTTAYHKYEPQLQVVGTVIYYIWDEFDGTAYQIWTATMDTDGTDWAATKKTTTAYDKEYPQLQVVDGEAYYIWQELDASTLYQIWTVAPFISYGEWVKFITAAPGSPGSKPTGYKNDICSDYSGYTYILNRSLTDDGASYESYFVLSTDLSGKKTLHTNKRLLDIFSYFANKGTGTAKIYVKRDTEPAWQYAGEISLTGEEEIIIKHLPSENEDTTGDVDFLAKHFLIKFTFSNDFEFIGMISEAVGIGDR